MNLENEIKKIYEDFFKDLNIDKKTGKVGDTNKRFATFPYIGSNYETAKKKILIVGLDIGKDEYKEDNIFQSIETRRSNVCIDCNFNHPHIPGTYGTALYFLKDLYNWNNVWDEIIKFPTFQKALKKQLHKNGENPLSYIALSNFYKFVQFDREKRAGDLDRKYIDAEFEENFFISEVKTLNPDIIIFQGKPKQVILEKLKNLNKEIYVGPHPTYREKGGRNAEVFCKKIL